MSQNTPEDDKAAADKKAADEKMAEARKLLSRILGGGGIIFLLADLYFVLSGRVNLGSGTTSMEIRRVVSMAEDPVEFWCIVAFTGLLGLGFLFAAIRARRV